MNGKATSSSTSELDKDGIKTSYLKVVALFQCIACGKKWASAHGWANEDEIDSNCEFCDKPAKLTDTKDEMLDLDTFNCPNDDCKDSWTLLHSEVEKASTAMQECSSCGTSTPPPKEPQQRFGRRYTFNCINEECEMSGEWSDFSTKRQKTQRCSGKNGNECGNRGEITGIAKKKYFRRRKNFKRNKDEEEDEDPERKHQSRFCEMCELCLRQGRGTCHDYRKVITETQQNKQTGQTIEKIVSVLRI